jgi:PRC-barrel domain
MAVVNQRVFVEAKMLKKLMISAAISALMVSGALAQANPPAASDGGAKFIASQSQDQWVFSKFKGTDVLGPDNAHIGNVNDLLMDRHGKVLGLIVGVGGFLGIGEKSVAIDMSAFQAVPPETGSTSGAGGQGAGAASSNNDPTAVKLKVTWTKEQLQSAPDFQYFKPPRPAAPTTGMAPRPTSPSPSQRQ